MKRLVAATLCVAAACLLTATGCRRNDEPPPNSANNMQPGMQPGYQQPPPGQPGYQQPPPGQPQPPPQQPPPAQPANTGFMGLPIPIPGMGGAPAGGGQQGGGGQEVANNPSMGAMATPVLTPLQQQHAPNGRQTGETLAGNLQAGQFIKTQVQLQPGKCYTGIGQGGQPVTVELMAQMGNMVVAQSQPALISVLGSGKDCYKNPTPLPMPVFFRVVAQGQGPVSAALYER